MTGAEVPPRGGTTVGSGAGPAWHSEQLAREIPGAGSQWLPRAGHMLMYEAPSAVVQAVAS